MMQTILRQRFTLLLDLAKDPRYQLVARENIAAAKELVDTLLACGMILPDQHRACRAEVFGASSVIGAAELKRGADARKTTETGERS